MPGYTPKITRPGRGFSRHNTQRGIALIGVLWLIALMGALALAIIAIAKTDHLTAHEAADDLAAEGWADAGLFLAIHKLCDRHADMQIPVDGQTVQFTIGNEPVTVSVQDELGKLDINFAPRDLLESLFAAAGLTANDSDAVARAIDSKRNAAFTRVADQLTAGTGGTPAFPFRSVEELKSIPGITDDLFDRLRPALTVYSQQPMVQTATAPPIVLQALPGIDARKIDDIIAARRDHPVTAGSLGFTEGASGQGAAAGRSFTIRTRAQAGAAIFVRRAVVLITGDAHHPYQILEWQADNP